MRFKIKSAEGTWPRRVKRRDPKEPKTIKARIERAAREEEKGTP